MESLDVCIENLSNLRSLTIKGLRKLTTLPINPEFYASNLQYLFIIDCVSHHPFVVTTQTKIEVSHASMMMNRYKKKQILHQIHKHFYSLSSQTYITLDMGYQSAQRHTNSSNYSLALYLFQIHELYFIYKV